MRGFLLVEGSAWSCGPCSKGRWEAVDLCPGSVGNSLNCARGNLKAERITISSVLGQVSNWFWFGAVGKAMRTQKNVGKEAVQVTYSWLETNEVSLVLFPRWIRNNSFRKLPSLLAFYFFFKRFWVWAYKLKGHFLNLYGSIITLVFQMLSKSQQNLKSPVSSSLSTINNTTNYPRLSKEWLSASGSSNTTLSLVFL